MANERGDEDFSGDLSVLQQRLDAIEFKITSFDELENSIYDFFSKFEQKVSDIADAKVAAIKSDGESKQTDDKLKEIETALVSLSKDVSDVSKQAKDIITRAAFSKGGKEDIDFEAIITARLDEFEEKLKENLEGRLLNPKDIAEQNDAETPKDLSRFADNVNKKINNLSTEFDDFQRTCAPHEYVEMLETEFRNKFSKVNERFDELMQTMPVDRTKIMNTQKDFDELRQEINDFRINELLPSKQGVEDVEQDITRLKDQIKAIRETELMPLELGKTRGKRPGDTGNINIDAFNKQVQWLKNELERVDSLQEEIVNLRQMVVESKPNDSLLKKDLLLLQDELISLKENLPNKEDGDLKNDLSLLSNEINKIKQDLKKPGKDESSTLKNDFSLLQDEFAKIRDDLTKVPDKPIDATKIFAIEKSMLGLKDDLTKFSLQMNDMKKSDSQKKLDAISERLDKLDANFSQFRNYTVEQVTKISKWIEFIDRCMK